MIIGRRFHPDPLLFSNGWHISKTKFHRLTNLNTHKHNNQSFQLQQNNVEIK